MTDLILEYGNSFPVVSNLSQHEVALFNNVQYPPRYFNRCQNGDLIIESGFFDDSKKVPDVYRYDLVNINGQWELVYPNTSILAQPGCYHHDVDIDPNKNNILVILESPHKDEYCKKCFNPIAPANGPTGRNFCKRFISVIITLSIPHRCNLQLTEKKYSICFINPVQFQTSLHFIRGGGLDKSIEKELRDKVWDKLFFHSQNDFIPRLQRYNPVVILNACTGSKDGLIPPRTLKDYVRTTVNNRGHLACIPKFNTYHPSAWCGVHLTKLEICTPW